MEWLDCNLTSVLGGFQNMRNQSGINASTGTEREGFLLLDKYIAADMA